MKSYFTISGITLLLTLTLFEFYFRVIDNRFYTQSELEQLPYVFDHDKESIFNWYGLIRDRNGLTDLNTAEFSYTHEYHNDLRNNDIKLPVDSNTLRILCLGDSFTEGNGAPQDSTWTHLLQKKLENTNSLLNYEVINAGFMGADPIFNYMKYRDQLQWVNADIIIQAWTFNDVLDIDYKGGFERNNPDTTISFSFKAPKWIHLYEQSMAFRAIFHSLYDYKGSFRNPVESPDQEQIKRTVASIDSQYKELCKGNGSQYMTLLIPTTIEELRDSIPGLREVSNLINPSLMMETTIQKNQIDFDDYRWPLDRHFNSKGYELFAEAVYQTINTDTSFCKIFKQCKK